MIAEIMSELISVIIPAYNKSEELRASLASLLSQTYRNYEVIIVNDGSTDNTAHIIDEFKDKFCSRKIRFKIILQNNQGANAARNRGFREHHGGCVIFWDADVTAEPTMIEKMAKVLEEMGVNIILVGDSLGNVLLGYDSTREVTLQDMIRHTGAVRRGAVSSFINRFFRHNL